MTKQFVLKKVPGKKGTSTINYLYIAIGVMLVAFVVYYLVQLWKPKEHFEAAAAEGKVTLIYSQTCTHCQTFLPVFDEVCAQKAELFPTIKFSCSKYTSSDAEAAAYASKVSGVPAIFITSPDGKETHLVGSRSKDIFVSDIKSALEKKSS